KLLAEAALVGERVWDGLLEALAPGRPAPLVDALVREKLLVPEPDTKLAEQQEYRFQSELLRRAVIRMIPFADRPLVHLRIATWLASNAPLSFSEMISAQFRHGGALDAACAHGMAAADLYLQQEDTTKSDAIFELLVGLDVTADLRAQAALTWA